MKYVLLFCVLLLAAQCLAPGQGLVNFAHLRHLTERIAWNGDSVGIVHVYANYPGYEWVDAKESGPEGIACVDDAARAAVVYLRHYELTKSPQSLTEAKALLQFILNMQAPDGNFYNFVFADHTINKEGKTSFKSFGWWGARGVWAMAMGYRVMRDVDADFAVSLNSGVVKTFPHIDSLLLAYGKTRTIGSFVIPQWLLYESAADATSELTLGLIEYVRATNNERAAAYVRKFCNGFVVMQDGDEHTFPFGLHRSWETMWHMWGNGQTQALASAGGLFHDTLMIASARREAAGWYGRLLTHGFLKELDAADSTKASRFEQIAYGVRPLAVGLLRLYDATRDTLFLKMAGEAASWFMGNNIALQAMYDSATGRCYDGIRDSAAINRNSGAESTIECLHTLIELQAYPLAMRYFYSK
ncbi:MAG TPA: hypothetical protein VL633_01360 [Bacteroidota bacterium]|jgi:hypothetical protein|nr:hypothetical protein [Bacteroidota bacterium]